MRRFFFLSVLMLGIFTAKADAGVLIYTNLENGEDVVIGADPEFRDGFQMYQCRMKDRKLRLPGFNYMMDYRRHRDVICDPITEAPVRYIDTLRGVLQGSMDWDIVGESQENFQALVKEIETKREDGFFSKSHVDPNFIVVRLRVGNTTDQLRLPASGDIAPALRTILETRYKFLAKTDPQMGLAYGNLMHIIIQGAVARPFQGVTPRLSVFYDDAEQVGEFAKWTESQPKNLVDCMTLLREYSGHLQRTQTVAEKNLGILHKRRHTSSRVPAPTTSASGTKS